ANLPPKAGSRILEPCKPFHLLFGRFSGKVTYPVVLNHARIGQAAIDMINIGAPDTKETYMLGFKNGELHNQVYAPILQKLLESRNRTSVFPPPSIATGKVAVLIQFRNSLNILIIGRHLKRR